MSSEYERPGSEGDHGESGYDRPEYDATADACAYTSYDSSENSGEVEYQEKESADGEVPATGRNATDLERRVWEALYSIQDPEMPVSIVDLGLIYGVTVDGDDATAEVDMTLTYTGCPARDMLLGEVKRSVGDVEGIDDVDLRLVWSPGWTVDMVTDEGRKALRDFGLSV